MGFVIVGSCEIRLIGCDQRDAARVGKLDQLRLDFLFLRQAVALQFDVKPVAEHALQGVTTRTDKMALSGGNRLVEDTAGTASKRDQACAVGFQRGNFHMRAFGRRSVEIRQRRQFHQVAVASFVRRQQHEARQLPDRAGNLPQAVVLIAEVDGNRPADDRLDAIACDLVGELERTEHVVGVGQRQRGLAVGLSEFGELGDRQRAFE